MIRNILLVVLGIFVVGTGYWGYQEHREKNEVLIHAENNYQRAFHDLTYQIDLLHDKIGSTLAMNSRTSLSPALAEVWQVASNAHSDVGQLPLTLLPFNKTEEFLSDIAQFSYRTVIRDLEKKPLSDQEYNTLKELYKDSQEIQHELRTVQSKVIEHNLRWMDVEMALASGEKQMDNTIIDGFETVEENAQEYAEVDFGPSFQALKDSKSNTFNRLEGEEISKEEAEQRAREFLELEQDSVIHIVESGKGADNEFYSLTIVSEDDKSEMYMDMTKKGGYPIWILKNKEIKEQRLSLNEAQEKAAAYLKKNNFKNMIATESSQYDSVGVFTFVTSVNDIRIYPETITVKVGLGEGDIIGFTAREYLKAKAEHDTDTVPEISKEEAKKTINRNVEIMEDNLAIIRNDIGEEVLCYEFLGTINDDTYRIFINAQNGTEEKVEKLKAKEALF